MSQSEYSLGAIRIIKFPLPLHSARQPVERNPGLGRQGAPLRFAPAGALFRAPRRRLSPLRGKRFEEMVHEIKPCNQRGAKWFKSSGEITELSSQADLLASTGDDLAPFVASRIGAFTPETNRSLFVCGSVQVLPG